jgi:D-alanine-D-alanine ligase
MRIVFTHNLQLTNSEEEAEFDTPETVHMLLDALRALGHEVEPLEVSGPASRVVARLEALQPDLVFNTAEGTRGRLREAFYPALFDRLGMPFTGSDAYVCALTLDKQVAKMIVASRGVKTPAWRFCNDVTDLDISGLQFPLMVKPNFEGSSMGITQDSVVETQSELVARVVGLLARYPAGVLVEEYIEGQDIVVPFLEKASPQTEGVLEPAAYVYDKSDDDTRRHQIYDYDLKTTGSDKVSVQMPAPLSVDERATVMKLARTVYDALGVRDLGRIDFRRAADGTFYFLELNALPSLEKGASLYEAAKRIGLSSTEAVLDMVIRSAAERAGLNMKALKSPKKRSTLRVGLTYNLRRKPVGKGSDVDTDAEYDTPETVRAIHDAIASFGHDVIDLEATPELPALLPPAGVDLVFNVAEGMEGRNREAQVPALLELMGISYTGSDPAALSLCLDKALAKKLVAQGGFHTPSYTLLTTGKEKLPRGFQFPAIVKPVAEGSSKGIIEKSVVESESELRETARNAIARYKQPVIAETFLPGREFTVALLGEKKPRVLPPMEIVYLDKTEKHPIYSFAHKFQGGPVKGEVPANIDGALKREIERVTRGAFMVLGCRDFARIDVRCDANGHVHFIECNPLPGLSPGFSDLVLIAEAAGIDYRTLIGEIMSPALRRVREKRRERMLSTTA